MIPTCETCRFFARSARGFTLPVDDDEDEDVKETEHPPTGYMVATSIMRTNEAGDLEAHQRWLERVGLS